MSITSEAAVRIAKAHGLSMTDALSLQRLADTPEEAAALARTFVEPKPDPAATTKGINDRIRSAANRGRGTIKVTDDDREGIA